MGLLDRYERDATILGRRREPPRAVRENLARAGLLRFLDQPQPEMVDAHKNFAYSTVATAPVPATTGTTLTVASGDGAKFPAAPFNATVWPAGSQPIASNAEIVRVTAVAGDVFTMTSGRAQEGTTAKAIAVGYQIAATVTAKTLTDIETATTPSPSTVLALSNQMGSALQTILDGFPQAGSYQGGIVELMPGQGTIERPIIVPNAVKIIGAGGRGTSQLFLDSSFPSMTLNNGGTLTLPAATITVTSMSANMPTTGGVITMLSSAGIQKIFYTGISGNSFTGCSGGTGTVTDGAVVGTFAFWLGHPILDTSGVYGTRIESLYLDCSTDGTSANARPGVSGVYTNRAQEFSGCYQTLIRNFLHRGICIHGYKPSGQVTQDLIFRQLTIMAASTVTADAVGFEMDCAGSTYRGIDDVTFVAVGLTDTPATALKLIAANGVFGRFNFERNAVGVWIDSNAVAGSSKGLVIQGAIGFGTALTDLVKITGNPGNSSVALFGLAKYSAASANLINDALSGITSTKNSCGFYVLGEPNAGGKRSVHTDLADVMPRLAQNAGMPTIPGRSLGAVIRARAAYDETGALIGYVPIYNTITTPALALVQDDVGHNGRDNSSSTTLTITTTKATTAGNAIIVSGVVSNAATLSSATDSRGNTYYVTSVGSNASGFLAIATSLTTGLQIGDTITLTFSVANTYAAAIVSEFTGVYPTGNPIDKHPGTTGTSTSPNSGTTSLLTQANELVIGVITGVAGGTFTPGSSYTALTSASSGAGARTVWPEYKIVSATTAVAADATLGTSQQWSALLVSLLSS